MTQSSQPSSKAAKAIWTGLGLLSLAFGAIGVVLPLLPTTPFVILAAFAFSKSSPRLRNWLLEHRIFGTMIRDWEATGAIATRYKVMACVAMGLAFGLSVALGLRPMILGIQAVCLTASAVFILSRPSGS